MTDSDLKLDLAGWFPNENQRVLESLIKEHNVKSVIEVGCFLGRATVWFAQRVDKVTVVDIFEPSEERYLNTDTFRPKTEIMLDQFKRNMEFFNIKNVNIIKSDSMKASKRRISADLVYIDAAHTYERVKEDITLWLPKAKKVLAGDDYTSNWPGVVRAVDEAEFEVNKDSRCWYHIK